ncbi:MAG: hypothetical protein RLZZ387_1834 [Chloroflexota bacterium]
METIDTLVNTQLGPYLLEQVIGRGGAATVYRARQTSLGRDVAVKVLRRDADPQFAARFAREARAIAALQHPNILPVYDFGEHGDLQYLVMRYVEGGRTLRDALAAGPLDPADALRLMVRLLDALGESHARGVVHRDIKPGNVLLPAPDWPLLADFGIARLGTDTRQLTIAGQAIGTPDYMSPEQATGRPVDARSDIYSAGVMLYEMLAGQVPFRGESAIAVVAQHVNQPPPPPRLLNPDLPPAIEAPLLRALAKDPAERFQTAAEMAAALQSALSAIHSSGVPPGAPVPHETTATPTRRPVSPRPGPSSQHPRRLPPIPLLVGLALLVAIGAGLALAPGWGTGSGSAVTDPPAAQPGPPGEAPDPAPSAGGELPLRLEDSAWEGGFRRAGGVTSYGGRTATWIYGTSTEYSSMRATFELTEAPGCAARLYVMGMDSEGASKTNISVAVNGTEVYQGPNPLPDDDIPLDTGTWDTHAFTFDGSLLREGENEVSISNLDVGAFSLPPFFMLDYAELACER